MIWPTSDAIGNNAINLVTNSVPIAGQEQVFSDALTQIAADERLGDLLIYPPNLGRADVRAQAAQWIHRTTGIAAPPDQVFVTSGTQNALSVAFHLVAKPGDTILVESLTYPGIKAVARTMQVRLSGVDLDEEGMLPESLEAQCRSTQPKLICCVPTVQNPTGAVMSEKRRQEIAAVADRHGVPILEDGIYDFLNHHDPRPIMTWAQTPGYFATGLSKAVTPALRTGFLVVPPGQSDEATRIMGGMSLHAPLLMTEIARRWMKEGRIEEFEAVVRNDAMARQKIAREVLAGCDLNSHPAGFQTWLTNVIFDASRQSSICA